MAVQLKNISEINAVSGNEVKLRKYIEENIRADRLEVDTMGNLIAFVKGKKHDKTLAIVTHMDESGFIVSDFTDKGYIKFREVGNVDALSVISKRVIINESVRGVIGMKAIHLQKADERKNAVKLKDLFIDIGAKDKNEAEKYVKKGDYIAFDTEFAQIGKKVKGKALDRVGVYAQICSMSEQPQYDTYFIFTVQKEVGSRGAAVLTERIKADFAVVLGTVQSGDMFGSKIHAAKLEGGVAVSSMNKKMIADVQLTEQVRKAAESNNVKIQRICSMADFSDWEIGYIPNCRCIMADIPIRYAYTPAELVSTEDIEAAVQLLKIILNGEFTNGIIK